jgi:hypothetical protein
MGGSLRLVKEYIYAFRTLLLRGDRRHWVRVASGGVPHWDARNEMIAAAIPANSSVADLGCGPQTLRGHLKPGCIYKPFDQVRSSPSVGFIDINAGVYPRIDDVVDYIVVSGVLEYIWNPRELLGRIAPLARRICLSYNVLAPRETRRSRLAKLWVNHLTQTELEQMFSDLHLTWRVVDRSLPSEFIYMLEHTDAATAPDAKVRATQARRSD